MTIEIQSFITGLNQAQKIESAKEYSLGKFIADLSKIDQSLIVEFDNGIFPMVSEVYYAEEGDEKGTYKYIGEYFKYSKKTKSVFKSWRGSYCELAMNYSNENQSITAKQLLDMAKFINNKYLDGYKGGDFLMDLQTPIHIDNYGDSGGMKLTGVSIKDKKVLLITRKDNEY